MQVVAINPMAEARADEKMMIPRGSFAERHRKVFKSLGALGVLAVVGVVGYLAGTSSTRGNVDDAPASTDSEANPGTDGINAAMSTLKDAYIDPQNLALTSQLTITQINRLLDEYEADPATWFDNFLSPEIMESFKSLRDSHHQELVANGADRRQLYRALSSLSDPLVNLAYEEVENADFTGAVQYGDDFVQVKRSNGYCFVIAQESNSASDWWANLNLGGADILSINQYETQDEACGCADNSRGWCSTYNTCNMNIILGRGYKGFVQTFNAMKSAIWSKIQSTCSASDTKVLAGYSRGAAINTVLAFALQKENLIPANKMALITFGSPRTLEDSDSDYLHDLNFPKYRMIYKKDPVPSLPYGWLGFQHVGDMICHECGYSGRDKPNWSWPTDTGDHSGYCTLFGDKRCQ